MSISIYDTLSEKWTNSNSTLSQLRSKAGVCSLGTNIYVVGGMSGGAPSNSLEVYNTITDTWKTASSMPTARSNVAAVMVGNKMYTLGGSPSFNKVEIYDTETNSWTTGPALKKGRHSLGAVFANGTIYAMGGYLDNGVEPYVQSLQVGDSSDISSARLSVLLNTGEFVQLSTSFDLGNNRNFTWASTNESVATVDNNGKVTAVGVGNADIYAQNADGTFKEYIPVKVVEGIADELRLSVHLRAGEKAKLYLTDDPSQVIWSSIDDSTVTVSADGQVTGVKKGLAIVKAQLDGQSYQIYVRVTE